MTLAVSTTSILIHKQVRHTKKRQIECVWIKLIFIISPAKNKTVDKIGMASSKNGHNCSDK